MSGLGFNDEIVVLMLENGLLKEMKDWFVFSGDLNSTSVGVLNDDNGEVASESVRDSFGLIVKGFDGKLKVDWLC